jgi:hypothetical protein
MIDEAGASAGNFQAWSGQKIKWDIEGSSNVKSIKKIYPKTNNETVFSRGPKKTSLSKNWHGRLKETATDTLREYYNIDWINEVDHQKYTYDPFIQVNPR